MGVLITVTHTMDSGLLFIVVIGLFGSLLLVPLLKNINSFFIGDNTMSQPQIKPQDIQWQ